MRKIDIHCHTTTSRLRDTVPNSATIHDICEEMKRHDVAYTTVLATYFPEYGRGISNYRLWHWIKDEPRILMFGSLDFQHYFHTGIKELTELAESKMISGIKIYSGYQMIDYQSNAFATIIQLAGKYQLPLMFHGGFVQCHEDDIDKAFSPDILSSIAHAYPEVAIIVSHLAWPFVNELIQLVNATNNVYADMSGMLDSYKTRDTFSDCVQGIKHFLAECGPQKLLFGTDFPVQTHADSIALIESAMSSYRESDKELVYFKNASRLLKLSA